MKLNKITKFNSNLNNSSANYATIQAENILRQNRSAKKSHRRYFNRVLFIQRVQKLYSAFCENNNFLIFLKFTSVDDLELVLREIKKHISSDKENFFVKFDRSVWVDLSNLDKNLEPVCQHLFYLSPNGMFFFREFSDFSMVLRIILKLEKEEKFLSSVLMIRDSTVFYDFSSSAQSETLRSFYSTAQSKPEILLKISDAVQSLNFRLLGTLDSSDLVTRIEAGASAGLTFNLTHGLVDFLKK